MTLLFLSHSGADTEAARQLQARLEAAGIPVWFDKDDLAPGTDGWQRQLERVIGQEATAFAVYVGSRGIVNWVEAEVRLALSRTNSGGGAFPFVPILAASSPGSRALSGFAQQFQSVRDVENDPDQWNKLLATLANGAPAPPETEPFFGLRAIDETRSHLFFGRREETKKLVDIVAARNLLLVSGANRVHEKRAGRQIGEVLERSDADFVKEWTGFSIGGVSPFGHPAPLTTYLDQDLFKYDTVWAAAGDPRSVFEITAADLERSTGATKIDVT
jgi:hypothetical protein